MKKQLFMMAAALCASAVFTACSSEVAESVQTVAEPQDGYPIAIQATKAGGDITRALSLNGEETTLSTAWALNEKVYVYKNNDGDAVAELTPDENEVGSTHTTLKGTISGTGYSTNDKLTLYYLKEKGAGYTGQVGTIEDISANFDLCTTTVDILSVSATGVILSTSGANFERQQSVTKFQLFLGASPSTTEALASKLNISATGLAGDAGSGLDITPAVPTNKIFAALRNITGAQDYTFTATIGGRDFTTVKNAIDLPLNKYLGASLYLKRPLTASDLEIILNDVTEGSTLDGSNVSVTDGGNPLTQPTDYSVVYKKGGVEVTEATAMGEYEVVATFTGIYEGEDISLGTFEVTDLPTAVITVPTGKDGMVIAMGDNSQTVGASAVYGNTPTDITSQIVYSAEAGADGGSVTINPSTGAITPTHAGTVLITMTVAKSNGVYNGAKKTITVYIQQNGMGGDIEDPSNGGTTWQ